MITFFEIVCFAELIIIGMQYIDRERLQKTIEKLLERTERLEKARYGEKMYEVRKP